MLGLALDLMLADIRDDLAGFGVDFDRWYSEAALAAPVRIERALERLRSQAQMYSQGWRDSGSRPGNSATRRIGSSCARTASPPTSPPISPITWKSASAASQRLIDVLGADHHGYVARVRAGLTAMGEPGESLEVSLIQFVSLFRGGEKIADGQARGAVRHAAATARGSGQ